MPSRKFVGPFGGLEQRELARLIQFGAARREIVTFLVLRVRSSGDGRTRDTVATLAKWCGHSPTTVRRALDWLVARRLVLELKIRVKGGPAGTAFRYERVALSFGEWPEDVSTANTSIAEAVLNENTSSTLRHRPLSDQEVIRADVGSAHVTRSNPEVRTQSPSKYELEHSERVKSRSDIGKWIDGERAAGRPVAREDLRRYLDALAGMD